MNCKSKKCTKKLLVFGSKMPLVVTGSFKAEVSVGEFTDTAEFIVIEGQGQGILGKKILQ